MNRRNALKAAELIDAALKLIESEKELSYAKAYAARARNHIEKQIFERHKETKDERINR